MSDPIAYMPRPCDATRKAGPCPFRVDAPAGEFPASRFEKLADTAGEPGAEVPVGGPMFACHHTRDQADGTPAPIACAGWLAVCGRDHLGVRLAILDGRLPGSALRPPADVELFGSYEDMATQQADGLYDPQRADQWRRAAGHGRLHLQAVPEFCTGSARVRETRWTP